MTNYCKCDEKVFIIQIKKKKNFERSFIPIDGKINYFYHLHEKDNKQHAERGLQAINTITRGQLS